jgi:hypothetical protein
MAAPSCITTNDESTFLVFFLWSAFGIVAVSDFRHSFYFKICTNSMSKENEKSFMLLKCSFSHEKKVDYPMQGDAGR